MSGRKSEKSKSSKSTKRLDAALFFLLWTKNGLQAYTRNINELYLKILMEHTMKRKVEGGGDGSDEVEQLAAGMKVEDKSENHSIRERLKEAAARMAVWEGQPAAPGNKVCVAEVAATHRLGQLVKMSGQLLEIMEKMHKWSNDNFKLLKKHSISSDVIDYVLSMFESTCALGESFHLTSIDRSACKDAHKDYLRPNAKDDYEAKSAEALEIGESKTYIPPLEAKINNFRTIVHIMGSSLISIIQTYLRYVPQEQVDLHVKEVKDVLDRLPPMYLRVQDLTLSKASNDLLKDPPPNKRSYPLAPKDDGSTAATRSGTSVKSVRSGVQRSSKRSNRSNRSNKSNRSNRSRRSGSSRLTVRKSEYKSPIGSPPERQKTQDSKSEKEDKKSSEVASTVKTAAQ